MRSRIERIGRRGKDKGNRKRLAVKRRSGQPKKRKRKRRRKSGIFEERVKVNGLTSYWFLTVNTESIVWSVSSKTYIMLQGNGYAKS